MNKKKGFTLIELLGVIIILSVIAVIAVPIVVQYVNDSRVASKKESAYGYVKSVDNAVGIVSIDDSDRIINGTYNINSSGDLVNSTNSSDKLDVFYKGDKPTGSVKIEYDKVTSALLTYGTTTIKFENEQYTIK